MNKTNKDLNNDKSRLLIIGSSGFLGSNLYSLFKNNFDTYGTYFNNNASGLPLLNCDANSNQNLDYLIANLKPSLIINCAGLVNVEHCEIRPEAAWLINTSLAANLALKCIEKNIKFIQISTDHFISQNNLPISENDIVAPLNQYSFTKLAAEDSIKLINPHALIVRTNFIGLSKLSNRSLLSWAYTELKNDHAIYGFDDVFFTPVSIPVLALALKALVQKNASGIYNISSHTKISKYELLVKACNIWNFNYHKIQKSSISESILRAQRPHDLSLNNTKLTMLVGNVIPGLEEMINIASAV